MCARGGGGSSGDGGSGGGMCESARAGDFAYCAARLVLRVAARDLGRLEEAIAAIAAGAAAFELSTCRIGAAGADRLAAALQSSTAITRVDLRGECVAARGRWRRMHPV